MTAKLSQVLQIEPPQEIIFKGPFTEVVTSTLKLINPSDRQVCFKVKTTAPKQYCVRPNSGFIPAKGVVNVAVMLQPFDYNAEEKSKHKFMIQSAFVPDGETSLDTIWKNMAPDDLMDSKLKVLFEIPETISLTNNMDKSMAKPPPQKVVNAGSADSDLRRYQGDNKALQSKVQQLEQENEQLRTRISRSESASMQQKLGGSNDMSTAIQGLSEFKILHVIIAAIIALFFGMIVGKII